MYEALSPLDGRYATQLGDVAAEFSEAALIKQRFAVEVAWLLVLARHRGVVELEPFTEAEEDLLASWVDAFGAADVAAVKLTEQRIHHDVKAVEYHLKTKLENAGLARCVEFVHFACTSEDINNLAYTAMLRDGLTKVWLPAARSLVAEVQALAERHASLPMPSHTHGQPATPTTLGKELAVFVRRWHRQLGVVASTELLGKFNGAVGTYGAHHAAYPDLPWIQISRDFVESFGLGWNPLTTQIEPHDSMAEVFHALVRWNAILIDFCRDMWEYISRGYLSQASVAGEVGSSTMPHKVNPIDFENAEANAGMSTSILEHLATKLTISRMQRDLSDSSAIRNVGVGLGHATLAVASTRRGLARVAPAPAVMAAVLEGQWEVLAEAIQTVMRRYGLDEPYERLKSLTRGASVDADDVREFVSGLGLPADSEARLLLLTPATYTGLAAQLVAWATHP